MNELNSTEKNMADRIISEQTCKVYAIALQRLAIEIRKIISYEELDPCKDHRQSCDIASRILAAHIRKG